MNDVTFEFNKQLELDVLAGGLTEITSEYVGKFKWKKFDEIVIPEGVTSIGVSAFGGCEKLTSVTIPDTVTSVGDSAFSDCYDLIDITIGKGVTSIEDYAFLYCHKLKNITIPVSVAKIGVEAFYSCDGIKITFEGKTLDEVRSMEDYPWAISPGKIRVQVS
jgi:hypothetical protein